MNEEDQQIRIEAYRFAVDETPYCLWDHQLRKINHLSLSGFDPQYFAFVARKILAGPTDGDRANTTIALQSTYGHALETILSMLCATLQAPDCIAAWMLKYRNEELRSVVRKLTIGTPVRTYLRPRPTSWEALAQAVHAPCVAVKPELAARVPQIGNLWRMLAEDFLNEDHEPEYNAIKHGLRVQTGPISLSASPTRDAPPDITLHGFGSCFFRLERINGDKRNLWARQRFRSCSPDAIALRIELIACSLGMVAAHAMRKAGFKEGKLPIRYFEDAKAYEDCWKDDSTLRNMDFNIPISPAPGGLQTSEQILAAYEDEPGAASPRE